MYFDGKPITNSNLFFISPEWPIFYLDNHILALYKPAGLLVQGDKTGRISLLELVRLWIKQRFSKPGNVYIGLVHRLDFCVAGAMVFAKTSKAASRLSHQFREKKVVKEYLAVVEGTPKKKKATLIHHLIRKKNKTYSIPLGSLKNSKNKHAILSYEVLKTKANMSLLKVIPLTGRKHQIRAQLASIGHPIVGDKLYGSKTSLEDGKIIALISKRLIFTHPTTKKLLIIETPLPLNWPIEDEHIVSTRIPWKFSDYNIQLKIGGQDIPSTTSFTNPH